MLSAAGVPAAARSWAAGDLTPGLALWGRLADLGVTALAVPEKWGGLGASAADLATACEELGHHAVPGPVAESLAAVPALLSTLAETDWRTAPDEASPAADDSADRPAADRCGEWLAGLATGDLVATLAIPPLLPFAADAEAAGLVLLAEADAVSVGRAEARHRSVDPSRSLSVVTGDDSWPAMRPTAMASAFDLGVLACSAQLLGAARAMLEASVRHVSVRAQFGQPVGTFQAVKHKLADVAIALEFARPLLGAAAAAIDGDAATVPRDVSAAKVACGDAATLAARAALQVHGAIGYTAEHDLSRWLTKVRALAPTWGSQAWHRQRVVTSLALSSTAEPPVVGPSRLTSRPRAVTGHRARRVPVGLTAEQRDLRDAVRGLIARTGDAGSVWPRLGQEIGVAGLAIPERYGGAGAGLAETCVVMEELGRNLTPAPMLGSAVLAAQAVLASGDVAACERLLPAVADGSAIAALAWTTAAGHWDAAELGYDARAVGRHWQLTGEAHYVLDGAAAEVLLVAASTPDGSGLFEVDPQHDGVARTPVTVMDDSRDLAVVRLADAVGRRIGGDAAAPLAHARDQACIALGAEQVGAAERALELTVAHLLTRVQFGQPIGAFQALQHRAADLHILVESARSLSRATAADLARYCRPRPPRRRGQGLLLGDAHPDSERDDPAARRHRRHLGTPSPPLPQARAQRQAPVRQPRQPSVRHCGQSHRRTNWPRGR